MNEGNGRKKKSGGFKSPRAERCVIHRGPREKGGEWGSRESHAEDLLKERAEVSNCPTRPGIAKVE